MSELLEVQEDDYDGGCEVYDPLGLVYWRDSATYDCPEDLTCGRDVSAWIDEVNRLRALCAAHGLSCRPVDDA